MLIDIKMNERALLLREGQPVCLLSTGRHRYWFDTGLSVQRYQLDEVFTFLDTGTRCCDFKKRCCRCFD